MMEQNEIVDIQTYLPGYNSVKEYAQDAFKAVVVATKAANALPECGDRYEYYRSFHGFCELMREEANNIFTVMSSLVKSQGVKKSFKDLNAEDAFELLSDVNDKILEDANIALDEATGVKTTDTLSSEDLVVASIRTTPTINTSWNRVQSPAAPQGHTIRLLSAKNILRPQMKFKEKVDNSNTPFVPIIKDKPNSLKPLAILPEVIDGKEEFGNPYEWEIEKFKPADEMLEAVEPVLPKPLEETQCIFVETEDGLKEMCADLQNQTEIAIDLEHHSYRSFQGIVCLMQISTRTKDYIVDTFKLRSELQILNEIFTHPKIVKVLHGADMDVIWLQRDFGLYIVNMFDTGQAARVLNFAHFSLAYVVKLYCKMEMNKAFQLADWRIRPLPTEMVKYAREDTHYLLYIYDCLKNDLLQKGNELKNLLLSVFQRSKVLCLKTYEKPLFNDDSYLELYKKSKKVFNSRQLYALKELYSWRDAIARIEDESIGFILPNHMLLQIAEILPREQQGILACCNPVPPVVRQQLTDLHSIILKARDSSLSVFLESEKTPRPPEINIDVDLENIIHCPHDTHHHEESLHLATLFGEDAVASDSEDSCVTIKEKPSLSLTSSKQSMLQTSRVDHTKEYEDSIKAMASYLSPFCRYELVKKFNVAYKLGGSEEESMTDSDRVQRIQSHFKRLAAVADPENEDTDISCVTPQKPTSENNFVRPNENHTKADAEPLRKKEKKKKNKRKHENSDVGPETTSQHDVASAEDVTETSPRKKSKSSESSSKPQSEDRKQFNYFATSGSEPEGKSKTLKKKVFNPDSEEEDYQSPEKFWSQKKKHSKQATLSHSSKRSHSEKKNWPKR